MPTQHLGCSSGKSLATQRHNNIGHNHIGHSHRLCLYGQATFGLFLSQEFGYSAQTAGLLYIVTSAPTIFCSGIAGRLGNRYGRWRVTLHWPDDYSCGRLGMMHRSPVATCLGPMLEIFASLIRCRCYLWGC